jgi:hypothetical protein
VKRGSQFDPYKGQIIRWLEAHPLSAQQVFQRLREAGYPGGITIVNTYVRQIRPPQRKVFLKLNFARDECALQVLEPPCNPTFPIFSPRHTVLL